MRVTKTSLTQIIKETLKEVKDEPSDTSPEERRGNEIMSSMGSIPRLGSQSERIVAQPDLTHFLRSLMGSYFSHVDTNVKYRSMLELAEEFRTSNK